jgi:hypothetical protein
MREVSGEGGGCMTPDGAMRGDVKATLYLVRVWKK